MLSRAHVALVPALLAVAACSPAPSPGARDSAASPSAVASTPAVAPMPATTPAAVSRPDSASAGAAPVSAAFTRIVTQHTSGFDEAAQRVIRDQAAFQAAWKTVLGGIPGDPPPAVDFTKEMVILVALGGRSTGGHAVRIDAVTPSGDGAVVRYTVTRPGQGCMTTQSLTSPVEMVRAPRVNGAVRFDGRDVVQPC